SNPAGKVGKVAYLENNVSVLRTLKETREEFDIYFEWDDKDMGTPGAFYVTNKMNEEFFLVSVTIEYPSEHDKNNIHFDCNSWSYLPGKTPEQLKAYREEELKNLRGDGKGKREKGDRIYDYDVYNDLGFLDSDGQEHHPVLGGPEKPYPRRVRTGRTVIPRNGEKYELPEEVYYVPRDEDFSQQKTLEFLELSKKALGGKVRPLLLSLYSKTTSNEFNSFEEMLKMYEGGNPSVIDFPTPDVIKGGGPRIAKEHIMQLCSKQYSNKRKFGD
ncbi:hypothetical protein V8G54_003914, partial [Vigna mungo]